MSTQNPRFPCLGAATHSGGPAAALGRLASVGHQNFPSAAATPSIQPPLYPTAPQADPASGSATPLVLAGTGSHPLQSEMESYDPGVVGAVGPTDIADLG
jgi:hypothetical protein